jgi:hypothetical protein
MTKSDEYRVLLEHCLDQGNLTKWEDSFCVSLVDQLDRGRTLTERQAEILERIYTEKTK